MTWYCYPSSFLWIWHNNGHRKITRLWEPSFEAAYHWHHLTLKSLILSTMMNNGVKSILKEHTLFYTAEFLHKIWLIWFPRGKRPYNVTTKIYFDKISSRWLFKFQQKRLSFKNCFIDVLLLLFCYCYFELKKQDLKMFNDF